MRKLISFMHISLDGYVAGPHGEMNWIKVNDEIFGHVEKRIGTTDTALYGRVTYDMMEGYWPTAAAKPNASAHDKNHSKWYAHAHKLVLSRSMKGQELPQTTILSEDLVERIGQFKHTGGDQDILLFGSPTATHALMELGLIDGYWLFVNPVVLGEGIPLFAGKQQKAQLKLLNSQRFDCGVVELSYEVVNGQ